MKVIQEFWTNQAGWKTVHKKGELMKARLVLAFGGRGMMGKEETFEELKNKYPSAEIVMCSTSGEISNINVREESLSVIAMEFDKTEVRTCSFNVNDYENSHAVGKEIVKSLCDTGLSHVFLVSGGQSVNGGELVKGVNNFVCSKVAITGGLAGDGIEFNKTIAGLDKVAQEGEVIAIGFYGKDIVVGCGTGGGWDAFGPERLVTKSKGNILYELDGLSALDLYKKYLGEAAKDLPESALYFPLSINPGEGKASLVRTIIGIDEVEKSMTFAGDIPEGAIARLMRHNLNNLIEGSEQAAEESLSKFKPEVKPDVAILISCVGRKIVLGQDIEEEIEVVRELLGAETAISGFYSYGEIAPKGGYSQCELHNQTMTITTFSEK